MEALPSPKRRKLVETDNFGAVQDIESHRQRVQDALDASTALEYRNQYGQYPTPLALGIQVAKASLAYYSTLTQHAHDPIRLLDPSCGTGALISATLLASNQPDTDSADPNYVVESCVGYEYDARVAGHAQQIWFPINVVRVHHANFTELLQQQPEPLTTTTTTAPSVSRRANFIMANPPYVRHRHLSLAEKDRLQALASQQSGGIVCSKTAGLHCYFLLLTHAHMAPDAVAAWILPGEFMSVNYGSAMRKYLTSKVTLLRLHYFDTADAQFCDALVSTVIVWFVNRPVPTDAACVDCTAGGSIEAPTRHRKVPVVDLHARCEQKWNEFFLPAATTTACSSSVSEKTTTVGTHDDETAATDVATATAVTGFDPDMMLRCSPAASSVLQEQPPPQSERLLDEDDEDVTVVRLGDLVDIKRGIATGNDKFFIMNPTEASQRNLPPQFLRPLLPNSPLVNAATDEVPVTIQHNRLLLDCTLPLEDIRRDYPTLAAYLDMGVADNVPEGYLCSKRRPWYRQEVRDAPMIVINSRGRETKQRSSPFRVIRNRSTAIASSHYLQLTAAANAAIPSWTDADMDTLWRLLRGIPVHQFLTHARPYGGGLYDLKPKDLAQVPIAIPKRFLAYIKSEET